VPEVWPRFTPDEIAGFAAMPDAAVAARVLSAFAGDTLTEAECEALCHAAYAGFDHPAATPLVQMDANRWLLELFRGPTLAFKDVAMQLLARLYDLVLERRGETLTIVAATLGDTGGRRAGRGVSRLAKCRW
jgi:threonine synthase